MSFQSVANRSERRRDGEGMIFTEVELQEQSAVPVPAHPSALRKGYQGAHSSLSPDTRTVLRSLERAKDGLARLKVEESLKGLGDALDRMRRGR